MTTRFPDSEPTEEQRDRARLARGLFRRQETLRKITHAETDWDMLFSLPALYDVSVKETANLFLAQREASEARTDAPKTIPLGAFDSLPYPAAVAKFALAWKVALQNANRMKLRAVPAEEQKIIREIKSLIRITEGSASSQNEREIAYRRIASLSKKLHSIVIPDRALAAIETVAYREIEATS